jgi:hypothetical protein
MSTYKVTTISGTYTVEAETSGQAERIIQQQTKEQVFSVVEVNL